MKLTIEIPEGKKAVWKDNQIIFEDIELPNTWEEFCKQNRITKNEVFISNSCTIVKMKEENIRHTQCDKNILPNTKAAEQHLALMQLHQLRDCYRRGWKPDLADPKNIFAIFHYRDKYSVKNFVASSKFLSFQSEEIANKFLHNFKDLIEQARDLI